MKITCTKCNKTKLHNYFTPDKRTKTGFFAWCKSCKLSYQRDWRSKNMTSKRKKAKAKSNKISYEKHHEKRRLDQLDARLVSRYGITKYQYDEMFTEQEGLCAICGRHANEFIKSLHVDHCHKTGLVRGLLCVTCNVRLGILENHEWVTKAQKYLREQ